MTPSNPLWFAQPSFPNESASIPAWLKLLSSLGAAWLLYEIFCEGEGGSHVRRDTFRYQLFDGPRKVQDGITNDPVRRCAEHIAAGKRFTSMRVVGQSVTRASALAWERASIESYRQRHGGKRARYNKI